MTALRALIFVALVSIPAWASAASPAVVTTVRGDVTLSGGASLAPPPALIPEGEILSLAEGATVVLWQGAALKFDGPCVVDPATLLAPEEASSEHASALMGLLTRQSSTTRPAASRGGATVDLTRPVAGLPLLKLRDIRWTCAGCGALDVVVEDARAETVVWSSSGDGRVVYDGPELQPGSYYLRLGGVDHLFRVVSNSDAWTMSVALEAAADLADTLSDDDPAARLGLATAMLVNEGLFTDALYRVDDAIALHPEDEHLKRLLADYETRAGLRR